MAKHFQIKKSSHIFWIYNSEQQKITFRAMFIIIIIIIFFNFSITCVMCLLLLLLLVVDGWMDILILTPNRRERERHEPDWWWWWRKWQPLWSCVIRKKMVAVYLFCFFFHSIKIGHPNLSGRNCICPLTVLFLFLSLVIISHFFLNPIIWQIYNWNKFIFFYDFFGHYHFMDQSIFF